VELAIDIERLHFFDPETGLAMRRAAAREAQGTLR
jgi:hypothetical protein